jgi:RND family efflux transporter MFP subunit
MHYCPQRYLFNNEKTSEEETMVSRRKTTSAARIIYTIRLSSWLAIAFAAVCLLSACAEKEAPEIKQIVRPVKLMTVVSSGEALQRRFPGRVRAAMRVDLAFQVGGPLVELTAEEGETVKEGDVLARIDPRNFETDLKNAQGRMARAKAALDSAQSEYARIQRIREADPGAASESIEVRRRETVEKARADVASAEASVKSASDRLADTYLRSPFDGVVSRRYVENFQEVRPKETILSIDDVSRIEIVVDIPELIMARVRANRARDIHAEFAAMPGKRYPLTVKEYATRADPATNTYQFVLEMPQPEDLNVLPGMTAIVSGSDPMAHASATPFVVPAFAVFADDGGQSRVWVVDEEKMTVASREVSTGSVTGTESIEIIDGLASGEIIAITGVTRLREGMQVRDLAKMEGYGK